MGYGRYGSARVALLTITAEEFAAAQETLGAHIQVPGTCYYVSAEPESSNYGFVLRQALDRSNLPTSDSVGSFVEHFEPDFFFLMGTAGGIYGRDDIALGDILVPDYVDYVGFRKLLPGRNLQRHVPLDHPSLFMRENYSRPLCREPRCSEWQDMIALEPPDTEFIPREAARPLRWIQDRMSPLPQGINVSVDRRPKAIEGNIVSSDSIWGDPTNEQQKLIIEEFDKALAFDMESFGLARKVCTLRNRLDYNPRYLVVRGISDYVNVMGNDRTRNDWTPYATHVAAAFTACLIEDILEVFPPEDTVADE